MSEIRSMVLLIFVLVISNHLIIAQNITDISFLKDSLSKYIEKGLKDWNIPGLAIAVIKNGKVVYIKGHGLRSMDTNEPVNENTLFQIASITKSFTATTATILQEEKKLSLDDKVVKWLPYFRLKNAFITQELDIYDLLSHRTGLKSHLGDLTHFRMDNTRKDVVESMATYNIDEKFRGSYGYSNSAYTAVGEIIAKANGKTWEESIKEKILNPLEMNRTKMILDNGWEDDNISKGYTLIDSKSVQVKPEVLNNMAPAGSMVSSVKDMSNWLLVQLSDGKFNGIQIIPTRAIKLARNPYNIQGLNQTYHARTHFYAYGLGYFIRDIEGILTFHHSGGISGFNSNHIIVPELNLGIVILTNNDTNNFYLDLTNIIVNAHLRLPFQDYLESSLNYKTLERERFAKELDSLKMLKKKKFQSKISIKRYLGKYTNESYGEIEIVKESEILKLKLKNDVSGELNYIGSNTFLCEFESHEYGTVTLPFIVEESFVKGLELTINNIEENSYMFLKK